MPHDNGHLSQLIKASEDISSQRTVILVDNSKKYQAYGRFDDCYDQEQSLTGVKAFFDASFEQLASMDKPVFSSDELPLLHYLGKWKVTLVTKSDTGDITITDASQTPVDAYMGLER